MRKWIHEQLDTLWYVIITNEKATSIYHSVVTPSRVRQSLARGVAYLAWLATPKGGAL